MRLSTGETVAGHVIELETNCFGRFRLAADGATTSGTPTCGGEGQPPDRSRVPEALAAAGWTLQEWNALVDDAERALPPVSPAFMVVTGVLTAVGVAFATMAVLVRRPCAVRAPACAALMGSRRCVAAGRRSPRWEGRSPCP